VLSGPLPSRRHLQGCTSSEDPASVAGLVGLARCGGACGRRARCARRRDGRGPDGEVWADGPRRWLASGRCGVASPGCPLLGPGEGSQLGWAIRDSVRRSAGRRSAGGRRGRGASRPSNAPPASSRGRPSGMPANSDSAAPLLHPRTRATPVHLPERAALPSNLAGPKWLSSSQPGRTGADRAANVCWSAARRRRRRQHPDQQHPHPRARPPRDRDQRGRGPADRARPTRPPSRVDPKRHSPTPEQATPRPSHRARGAPAQPGRLKAPSLTSPAAPAPRRPPRLKRATTRPDLTRRKWLSSTAS
jgi:hypothetical protein